MSESVPSDFAASRFNRRWLDVVGSIISGQRGLPVAPAKTKSEFAVWNDSSLWFKSITARSGSSGKRAWDASVFVA